MGMAKWGFGVVLLMCVLGVVSVQAQFGTLDATFHPEVTGATQSVRAIATQADGKAVVVGDFGSIDGRECRGVARFNADGTLDTDFAKGLAGTDGPVYCVSIQVDGKIVIGGDFSKVHGANCNRIARLNADGTLDTTFIVGSGVNGPVYAVAAMTSPMSDLMPEIFPVGILIGGDFTSVQGATRNRIALLSKTGYLNGSYYSGAGANGPVYAVCPIIPGYAYSVYVAGDFSQINGVTANRLAYMSSFGTTTSLSSAESAGPDGPVYALARNSINGRLYVGGGFRNYGGQPASYLVGVSSSGQLVEGFPSTSISGPVRAIASKEVTSDRMTTLSLYFGSVDAGVGHVGLISEVSVATTSFVITSTMEEGYAPQVNGIINGLSVTRDGKLLVGGVFTSVGVANQAGLARMYGREGNALPRKPDRPIASVGTDTKIFLNWSKVDNTTGHVIERSPDGVDNWERIFKGLSTTLTNPYIDGGLIPGTTYYYRVIACNSNGESTPSDVTSATTLPEPWTLAGALDAAFAIKTGTGAISTVYSFLVHSNGDIMVGGKFNTFNGGYGGTIVRLKSDGTLDTAFIFDIFNCYGATAKINAIAEQSDGSLIVAGSFNNPCSWQRNNIARLYPNGSFDYTWHFSTNSEVTSIAIQPDGKVIAVGFFTNGIVRIKVDEGNRADETFSAQLSPASGSAVVIQPDGKIVVAGNFQSANGMTCGNIARFNPDGTLDTSFASGSGANYQIGSMQLIANGKILIAGTFTKFNNVVRNGVARLNSDGSLDTAFDPVTTSTPNQPYCLVAQPDGKVIIGGSFLKTGDKTRIRLARLNADGSFDETFQPGLGADNSVAVLALQPDGKCLVGGTFTSVNGTTVNRIARLLADNGTAAPAAPSAVTATAVSTSSTRLAWDSIPFSSGYQIYQSIDGISDWTLVDIVPSSLHSTLITGLPAGSSRHYQVRAFNSNGTAPDSVMVTGTSFTPYQQWKVNQSLPVDASDTEDAIGKGVPHLLDYAFGGDPLAYDSQAILPRLDVPDSQMQITFWCDTDRSDLNYTVQASTDLIHWEDIAQCDGGATAAPVNEGSVVSDSGSGRRKVSVTDLAAIGTNQQRYLRVKVTTR